MSTRKRALEKNHPEIPTESNVTWVILYIVPQMASIKYRFVKCKIAFVFFVIFWSASYRMADTRGM